MTAKHSKAARRGLMESEYARNKRELMGFVNKIRSTGVGAVEIDLPTIVVAGNQSSGKSSLIEAISGINLPRADGTCTRVPIEVRLRSDEDKPWQCTVKIRREVNEDGADVESDGKKAEVDFGPPLSEPDQVEKVIRRAQLAILNPHESSVDKYVNHDLEAGEVGSISFSRNVVVLDISGPNLTDLTLVDLPGIFSSVSKGQDPNEITFVEDLVKSYIKRDCLILLVITTKDDIENQRAVMLARDADPDGKRTIGVLTKVDTLKGLENDRWVKVLRGEKEHLHHGYYATRQPNLDELSASISFDEARAKEVDFFKHNRPWSDTPAVKDRLGTKNLSSALSTHLLSLINQKLPHVIAQINEKYAGINKEIDALGSEPSTEPVREMLGLVATFVKIIEGKTIGDKDKSLIQEINRHYEEYKADIWGTRPRFTPFTRNQLKKSDDAQKAARLVDAFGRLPDFHEGVTPQEENTAEILTLDIVRERIKLAITRELPNNVPPSAKNALILEFMEGWGAIADELLGCIQPSLQKHVDEALRQVFGRYEHGDLPSSVDDVVKDRLGILATNARSLLAKMVELDSQPFTLNSHYITDVKSKALARLIDQRQPKPDLSDLQHVLQNALGNLGRLGYSGLSEHDLAKLRPTDEYMTEMEVMAEVRAYWQVAFKRIIDNVPRIIDNEFIRPAAEVLNAALIERMQLSTAQGAEQCARWLAESSYIVEKRADLKHRREVLGAAKAAIRARKFATA